MLFRSTAALSTYSDNHHIICILTLFMQAWLICHNVIRICTGIKWQHSDMHRLSVADSQEVKTHWDPQNTLCKGHIIQREKQEPHQYLNCLLRYIFFVPPLYSQFFSCILLVIIVSHYDINTKCLQLKEPSTSTCSQKKFDIKTTEINFPQTMLHFHPTK
jgi:hypothetical protein